MNVAINNTNGTDIIQISFAGRCLFVIFYSFIIILAIGGNAIVCFIIMAYQRMRTVTNYFIFNLAVSDILMTVICIPFSFVYTALLEYWPFGAFLCPTVSYVQSSSVFLSAFTLVAMSIDR